MNSFKFTSRKFSLLKKIKQNGVFSVMYCTVPYVNCVAAKLPAYGGAFDVTKMTEITAQSAGVEDKVG